MVKNKKLLKFESSKVHQNQTFSPYKFWFPTFQQVKNLLEHQKFQYSKINFLDFLPLLSSNWTSVHSVEKREILSHWKKISSNQLFSNFFSKTIDFTKFLPKKYEREFLQFPHCGVVKYYKTGWLILRTVWKLRKFTLAHFWQKIHESNVFTKEFTK